MTRPRPRALALAAAVAGGCDSYESRVPSCSGQEVCFDYNAVSSTDGPSVGGTLVFDALPPRGELSGTWAFESVGSSRFPSHPTGSGRFYGESGGGAIQLYVRSENAQVTIYGEYSPVVISGTWFGGTFSATRGRHDASGTPGTR